MSRSSTFDFLAVLLLASAACFASGSDPEPQDAALFNTDPERLDRWSEDLQHLATELPELHKNFFYAMAEEDFRRSVKELQADLARHSDPQITLRMMKLVAAAGDGHTTVASDWSNFHALPLSLYWFRDGVHVVAATESHVDKLGSRITHIGSVEIGEVIERLTPFISHDNRSGLKNQVPRFLQILEALQLIGAADGAGKTVDVTLVKDGSARTHSIESIPTPTLRRANWQPLQRTPPLCEQKMHLDFWNDWLADSSTLYFKYNRCREPEGFSKLVMGTRGFLQQNKAERFVIDLRHNGGGNSVVFLPLQLYIGSHVELNQPGRLYVILGRRTFSSALLNALDMKATRATFVGEPTGGRPNHFGEVRTFQLPNSGLTVTYSTKHFTRIIDSDPDSLMPDILVEPTFAQWAAGEDPVLDAVLEHSRSTLEPPGGRPR